MFAASPAALLVRSVVADSPLPTPLARPSCDIQESRGTESRSAQSLAEKVPGTTKQMHTWTRCMCIYMSHIATCRSAFTYSQRNAFSNIDADSCCSTYTYASTSTSTDTTTCLSVHTSAALQLYNYVWPNVYMPIHIYMRAYRNVPTSSHTMTHTPKSQHQHTNRPAYRRANAKISTYQHIIIPT